MIRIACIGNSHLAAFKDAADGIRAAHPDVQMQFFGLPNPVFFKSPKVDGGALNLAQPVDTVADQMIDPDGAYPIPLDTFDVVLLTSHGFYLRHFVAGFSGVDVLGFAETDAGKPLISMPCARDMIRTTCRTYADRLRTFFPEAPQIVVVQAPFPSREATQQSAELHNLFHHPARDALFDAYQTILAEVCFKQRLTLLPVPDAMIDVPFFTKPAFARRRDLPDETTAELTDYLHMNAGYAQAQFSEFYRTHIVG